MIMVDFSEIEMVEDVKLPVDYTKLDWRARRQVREQYIEDQKGLCMFCNTPLDDEPPAHVVKKKLDWSAFPPYFLKHPVHLQHNHSTGMTEGAIHAYCNAVLWQYHGR